jgi:hypothetical protein
VFSTDSAVSGNPSERSPGDEKVLLLPCQEDRKGSLDPTAMIMYP